jgi:hypothetical protein
MGLALASGLALAAVSSSASARSVTGFGSFRVSGAYATNPYTCLAENNGAVVNNCSFAVNLVFDLPIDNTGNHTITLQNYWNSTAAFWCEPYSYAGTGPGVAGVGGSFSPYSGHSIGLQINTPNNGESIQLICWGVPTGAGIANINWSY